MVQSLYQTGQNDGMSDEPKKRPRAWIGWVAVLTLLVLYPLSMGPAYGPAMPLFEAKTLSTAYAPMWWVWQHCRWATGPIDWYLRRGWCRLLK